MMILQPYSRKIPVLGDMAKPCIKFWGSNHVGSLTRSTWHALCSNLNVLSVLPKYTVTEPGCMEELQKVCKYSNIPNKFWKVGTFFYEEIPEKVQKQLRRSIQKLYFVIHDHPQPHLHGPSSFILVPGTICETVRFFQNIFYPCQGREG